MDQISFQAVRVAQRRWAATPIGERLAIVRAARRVIAGRAGDFAGSVSLPGRRLPVETLPMEVLPLLEAMRFLERCAPRVLAPRRLGRRGRPLWLTGVACEIRREPFGIVLVIGPFNYPLFLPGVQAVQALAAGNAVVVKPSPGHGAPMDLLRDVLERCGLPPGLMTVIGDSADAARTAIEAGVDKIVLTGSAATGRAVLEEAARRLIPATVELSGNDAVFILPGADLGHAARALAYGLRLNGGATCIAPRRVYVPAGQLGALREKLARALGGSAAVPLEARTATLVTRCLDEARQAGAEIVGGILSGDGLSITPAVVVAPPPAAALLVEDLFAPVLSLIPVSDMEEAFILAAQCPYRLGAAIFGPREAAEALVDRLDVGTVVVNDLIVPTADPRLPFEGRGDSGFGATRGYDGLREMTRGKAVALRRNRSEWHFEATRAAQQDLFLHIIAILHGTGGWRNIPAALAAAMRR